MLYWPGGDQPILELRMSYVPTYETTPYVD